MSGDCLSRPPQPSADPDFVAMRDDVVRSLVAGNWTMALCRLDAMERAVGTDPDRADYFAQFDRELLEIVEESAPWALIEPVIEHPLLLPVPLEIFNSEADWRICAGHCSGPACGG